MSIGEENKEQAESGVKLFGFDVTIRGVLAIMLVGTVCAMTLLQRKVEEPLYSAVLLVLGLYFGQRKSA